MTSIFDYVEEEEEVKPASSPSIFNYIDEEEKPATRMTRRGVRPSPVRETPKQFEYTYSEDLYEPKKETEYEELVNPQNIDVMKKYLSHPRFGKLAENLDQQSEEDIRSRL
jgi:hypothetical protein